MMAIRAKLPLLGLMATVLALCYATKGEAKHCTSSCGNITIRHPFLIKGDLRFCGDQRLELSCQNNRTLLYLLSGSYYVQDISYDNLTIRLVDASLDPDKCSIPSNSITVDDCRNPYSLIHDLYTYANVFFLNCTTPVNSSLYVDVSPCTNISSSSPFNYLYALYGVANNSLIHESCSVQVQSLAHSFNITSPSIFDIYKQLLMGFELSWASYKYSCLRSEMTLLERFVEFFYSLPYSYRNRVIFMETTGGFILGRAMLGAICLLAIIVHRFRRRHLSMDNMIEEFLQSQNNLMPIRYSYSDIKRMTNNFKHKLGEGGFGCVFKGKLKSRTYVAVKLLGKSKENGQDFINEVATMGRIHHANVMQLTGFCTEGSKQALVYDFMPNGSLDKFLSSKAGDSSNIPLSLEKLYEIALRVARGIEYLHGGCEMQILHFDIKPHNILLDDKFNPKVSDFGVAKLYPIEDSVVSLTAAQGTLGYIAPELFYKNLGPISHKADVYSFGMLLLEMVGSKKNLNYEFADQQSSDEDVYLPSWIYDRLARGEDMGLMDEIEGENKIARKMVLVSFRCIQIKPTNRPSMKEVLEMLENSVDELQELPPRPFI
ncbi:Pkinase domain-containing protein/GUB_WAK_bind domain-containing protein [Cephalotus follicularis]|uniref:Pkinase domain-containing protein/GUB_WAK_bind domain-containing protein n=1 Tax=Cephalotus follicularis TaxID=3775 RepID=A0A1Q3BHL6_CEPFO|nr:Pkinase domain-containing protein/GUB_WAK_bind domain-containing protein [Cephalotus follicularis]